MRFRILCTLVLVLLLTSCQLEENYIRLNGFTMGTSYQVTLQTSQDNADHLHLLIEAKLQHINQLMSTYIRDSELSQFNRSNSMDCQPISDETFYVIKSAIEVSKKTQGKFDITLAPLISEWGFDNKQTNNHIPEEKKIQQLLTQIGYSKLHLEEPQLGQPCVQKMHKDLSVNLSAIAKGYGVDQISELLTNNKIQNYLVEIGGETASKGLNPKSKIWRLAIEAPIAEQRQIQQIFSPNELGVATSGDYRNYFEKDGVRFSHTIDPTTGRPITHKLVSVTVLHQQTMLADAYATAFMVMGQEKAIIFAEENKLPIYLLVKDGEAFRVIYSEAFKKYLL